MLHEFKHLLVRCIQVFRVDIHVVLNVERFYLLQYMELKQCPFASFQGFSFDFHKLTHWFRRSQFFPCVELWFSMLEG